MHPLGLCNNNDEEDLYEYGWVGVVKLEQPDLEPKPCLTVLGKVRRAEHFPCSRVLAGGEKPGVVVCNLLRNSFLLFLTSLGTQFYTSHNTPSFSLVKPMQICQCLGVLECVIGFIGKWQNIYFPKVSELVLLQ